MAMGIIGPTIRMCILLAFHRSLRSSEDVQPQHCYAFPCCGIVRGTYFGPSYRLLSLDRRMDEHASDCRVVKHAAESICMLSPNLVILELTVSFQSSGSAVFKDATLPQTLHISVAAEKNRIVFSNTFGGSDLPITGANVALPTGGKAGVSGIQVSPVLPVTFGGKTSGIVPRGNTLTSDELPFPVQAQQMITVTLYFQTGQSGSNIDGHPGSRTTSWMQMGNHLTATTISGSSVAHW